MQLIKQYVVLSDTERIKIPNGRLQSSSYTNGQTLMKTAKVCK